MDSILFYETLALDMNFLKSYIFLCDKYSRNYQTNFVKDRLKEFIESNNVQSLIVDLEKKFLCRSVALLHVEKSANTLASICYTSNQSNYIKSLLEEGEIIKNISQQVLESKYEGASFAPMNLRNNKIKDNVAEIDLILLPPILNYFDSANSVYLLLLVDAVQLSPIANHLAERNFQRMMLAHFICGWWSKIFTPMSSQTAPIEVSQNSSVLLSKFPLWMYMATLSELLNEGNKSAQYIRRYKLSEIYFWSENSQNRFIWSEWFPRLPFLKFTKTQLNNLRETCRSLIYWCRWIGSHNDLEEENNINSASMNMTIQPDRMNNKVSEWVKGQRKEVKTIEKHLKELRKISAYYFSNNSNEIGL